MSGAFLPDVRNFGTHQAHTFFFAKVSWTKECTLSCLSPLTHLHIVDCLNLSADIKGLPELGLLSRLPQPRSHSHAHLFTVAYQGASFPCVVLTSSWMTLGVQPYFSKYSITVRSFSLSIFLRSQICGFDHQCKKKVESVEYSCKYQPNVKITPIV